MRACPQCEKVKPDPDFWDQKAHVLRERCKSCRWQNRVRSPRHLGARARNLQKKRAADQYWEQQAQEHM